MNQFLNTRWTKKLENYKILGRLSSYVASYHYSYLKPLHYPRRVCPAHAILTLGVYQDSRSWRSTSIFSDLALYLLFICNERNVFLLFILLSPRITDFPYSEYFFQVTVLITQTFISHETTLPRTLKRLMTVSYVGLYSSTDGNLWKTIAAKIYEKEKILTKLYSKFKCSKFVHCMEWD